MSLVQAGKPRRSLPPPLPLPFLIQDNESSTNSEDPVLISDLVDSDTSREKCTNSIGRFRLDGLYPSLFRGTQIHVLLVSDEKGDVLKIYELIYGAPGDKTVDLAGTINMSSHLTNILHYADVATPPFSQKVTNHSLLGPVGP
jgi:hypothetical protein